MVRTTSYSALVGILFLLPATTVTLEVAKGKATSQSTTVHGGTSNRAVDGNTDGRWPSKSCTHSNLEANPWWRVDLSSSKTVIEVAIYNRVDCCKFRLSNMEIRIGDSLANNGNNNPVCRNSLSLASKNMGLFSCSRPLKGRYVNIRLVGNRKVLTLCEVQVYTGECNKGWTAFGRSLYKLCDTPTRNWIDAQKTCQNMGANLPKIETDAENTFLYNFQKNTKMQHIWFGMTRDQNNQFYWFDGSRLTYTNWSPGEPNHWGGREHCAVMSLARNRKWNDVSCIWAGAAPRFICEVPKCNKKHLAPPGSTTTQPTMRSSSDMDSNHTSVAGNLLNSTSIWCPQSNSTIEWLQVDLGAPYSVCGVAAVNDFVVGSSASATWYRVSTSLTEFIQDTNQDNSSQELQTNSGSNSLVVKEFHRIARYVRFNPTRWTGWPCMKIAVYGDKVPPLKMEFSFNNRTVEHVSTTVFRCIAFGFPFPRYTWTRNGSSVIANGVLSEQNTILTITPVDLDSAGWYNCTASNAFGSVSSSAYLTVHAKPQDLKAPSPVNGFRGKDAVLSCESLAHPVANVTWINNNMDISADRYVVNTVLVSGTKARLVSTLTIRSVTVKDSGWYTCRFWNYRGSIEDSIELQIVDACVPVVFSFEDGPTSLDNWGRTGSAFNNQPTYGDNVSKRLVGQTANQQGTYWIGTYENRLNPQAHPGSIQGDRPQGTLTSPEFQITGPQVSFLVGGGGCRYRRNAVQLLVDGLVVLSVSGQCREQMTRQSWSLQQYIGKRARLRLIDFYGGGWGHINFDDFKGNVTRCTGCSEPLGLELGKVPNFAMTASSMWDKNHGPYYGRLNMLRRGGHVGSWSSRYNAIGQWLQVDLGTVVDVTKVATQGRADWNQWVTGYAIAYSYNLSAWQFYQDGTALRGNRDRNTMVEYLLSPTIRGRYIRIYPRTWRGHMSMRLELFGCPPKPAAPKISGLQKEVRAKIGSMVTLFCDADGFPYRSYIWSKQDTSGSVITLTTTQQLVIRNISVASDMIYTCTASNSVGKDSFAVHVIVHTFPSLTKGLLAKQYLTKGETSTLSCQGQGVPTPVVTWYKDGQRVTNSTRLYVTTSGSNAVISSILITDTQYRDSGVYTCVMSNVEGSINSSGIVELNGAPEFVISPRDTNVVQGNDVKLPCSAYGVPTPIIRWKFKGKYLENAVVTNNGTLVIENALNNEFFEGVYTCEATNPVGTNSKSAKLDVFIPTSFTTGIPAKALNFAIGQTAIVHCNVNGDPQPVVQWTKDGAPLEQTTRTQFLSSKQILAIHELVTTDTGRYKCLAKNPAGNVTASVDIIVYGKPTVNAVLTRKEVGARVGQKTNLQCFASNTFPVNYTWTKDGRPVVDSDNIVVHNNILIVTPKRANDFGVYVCNLANPAGSASYSIKLTEHGTRTGPVAGAQSSPNETKKVSAAISVPLVLIIVVLLVAVAFFVYRYRKVQQFARENPAYNMSTIEHSPGANAASDGVDNPMYGSAVGFSQETGDTNSNKETTAGRKGEPPYTKFE